MCSGLDTSREAGASEGRADVVVLGAGPAGAAAATALVRTGLKVVLLARPGTGPPDRYETLPPEIQVPLAALGLWEHFRAAGHLPSPGILSAWGGPGLIATDALFNPYGPGWHVDRGCFDALLVEGAADVGVIVRRDLLVTRLGRGPSGDWTLEGNSGGRPVALRAGFLIDATGRAASPARRLGGGRVVLDRLVGLVAMISPDPSTPCPDRRLLVEAVADGWWYAAPLPDAQRLLLAFFTDADLLPRGRDALAPHWRTRLQQAPYATQRLGIHARLDGLHLMSASTSQARRVAGAGWLAVGDAAATLDPLCGQGVYRALESGLRAAAAVGSSLSGSREALSDYARHAEADFAAYLRERVAYYRAERRWRPAPFWQRRHSTG
jgi:flavin-dependent dehydrogenase